jgi:hypothetical protein
MLPSLDTNISLFSNLDGTMVMKFFSDRGVRVKIQTECGTVETAGLLMVDNHKLGVVLNWKAEGSDRILREVSRSQAACSNVTFPSL